MTEVETPPKDPIEKRGHAKVEELASEVEVIPELNVNSYAEFEIFSGLPIKAGFSWGKGSGTMSRKWKGKSERLADVENRIRIFNDSLGINYPGVIHMLGVLEGEQEQLQEVDQSDLDLDQFETNIKANFVYTKDPDVAVVIRPGDCPISVIYGKTKDGVGIAGFIHSAGVSVNAGIPRMAIDRLINDEEVVPETIRIGITPGISREHYSINDEITTERTTFPIVERNWKNHIDENKSGDPKARRNVDILGATIMQYIEAGINPDQIEAYDVDTYTGQSEGVGFSHRFYQEHQDEDVSPGRFMVAVQLKSSN